MKKIEEPEQNGLQSALDRSFYRDNAHLKEALDKLDGVWSRGVPSTVF